MGLPRFLSFRAFVTCPLQDAQALSREHTANACSRPIGSCSVDRNCELDDTFHIASTLQGSFKSCQLSHAYMVEYGLMDDTYLLNLILRAYGKSGAMLDAHAVFNSMRRPNIISWNTLLGAYAFYDQSDEVESLFNSMRQRNIVSWNTLITAYSHQGKCRNALYLFQRLFEECELPNDVTFINILTACSKLAELQTGRVIHVRIHMCGLDMNVTVGTALVHMYAKCRDLDFACNAFYQLPERDVVSWTSLISAQAQLGSADLAICSYEQMQQEGVLSTKFTIESILTVAAKKLSLNQGKALHACICFGCSKPDVNTGNSLINMYAKCGSMRYAWFIFECLQSDATIVWNTMISACVEELYYLQALSLYNQMLQRGLCPDEFTFASVLSVCAFLLSFDIGMMVHSQLLEEGHMQDLVLSNTLITFYSKCKAFDEAKFVFKKMQVHNVVTWTSMMAAYAQTGLYEQVFTLFSEMQLQQVRPNDFTVITLLVACADSIALERGRELHAWIALERNGCFSKVSNGIINMYAKCGAVEDAFSFFNHLGCMDNAIPWNAMLNGLAYRGHGRATFAFFKRMLKEGTEPDEWTYVALLSACSHSGMVEEGNLMI
ncbi:hypothetical protein KP509_13G048700 [Ceratopteris richardii]|uniref:Pentatricopeptide repeat-containing protein n=1 Tax=Ceratopteris richardii TaxID=49495 RepID=A0A8T2TIK7_CERRI|nr:hypothetical protein KP509_13G048700 [Ceratopteris richardii]